MSRRFILIAAVASSMITGMLVAGPAEAVSRPAVGSVSPASGKTAGGTRVTVTGSTFRRVKYVRFGTAYGRSITVLSTTKLRVTAPAHSAGTVHVRVTTAYGTSTIRSADRYTYVAPPKVTGRLPTSGKTAGGTRVKLTGANFTKVTAVRFGTAAGRSLSVASSTTLSVTAPAHAAGTVDIRVTTAYGTSPAVTADRFTYVAPPTITSVQPSSGSLHGAGPVTIRGANFVQVRSVTFGGVVAPVLSGSTATALKVTAPARPLGPVDVRVTTAYGTSGAGRFSYVLGWASPLALNPLHGWPKAVSCPTSTFCVAVDEHGSMVVYDNGTWSPPTRIDGNRNLVSVSCTSPAFCMAVDSARRAIRISSSGTVWSAPTSIGGVTTYDTLSGVSCASPTFCVVVGKVFGASRGYAATFNGMTWSPPTTVDQGAGLEAVSCAPGASFCAAVDGWGSALTYSGGSWSAPVVVEEFVGLPAVSCPTASFCLAADTSGNAFTYDLGTWSGPTGVSGLANIRAVSCTSPSFCMAIDSGGHAASWTGTWSTATAVGGSVFGTSCAAPTFCVAVGGSFGTIAGFAARYNGSSWSAPEIVDPENELVDVSCASSTFCVAVDELGKAWTFTGSWSAPQNVDPDGLAAVSCPTTTFCLAVDAAGGQVTYDGSTWSAPSATGYTDMVDVSCSSPTFCGAVTEAYQAVTYNGSTWSHAWTDSEVITSVSCAGQFCMAVEGVRDTFAFNASGLIHGYSIGDDNGNADWLDSVSCTSTMHCVAADRTGYVATFNGTGWSAPVDRDINQVACASPTYCVGISAGRAYTYAGSAWLPATTIETDSTDYLTGIAVVAPSFAMAIDHGGNVIVTG